MTQLNERAPAVTDAGTDPVAHAGPDAHTTSAPATSPPPPTPKESPTEPTPPQRCRPGPVVTAYGATRLRERRSPRFNNSTKP